MECSLVGSSSSTIRFWARFREVHSYMPVTPFPFSFRTYIGYRYSVCTVKNCFGCTWEILNGTPQDWTSCCSSGMCVPLLPLRSPLSWSRRSARWMMFLTSTSETLRSKCSSSRTYWEGCRWSSGECLLPRCFSGLEKAQFVVREDRVRRVPLGGGVLYTASGTLVSHLWNQKL